MEFSPQGFTKGSAGQMHQAGGAAAAADRNEITGSQFTYHLAVGTQNGCRLDADDLYLDSGTERHNQRAVRKRVWADRRDFDNLRRGEYDGTARRQRIGRRACGSAKDQTIAPVTR